MTVALSVISILLGFLLWAVIISLGLVFLRMIAKVLFMVLVCYGLHMSCGVSYGILGWALAAALILCVIVDVQSLFE